MKQIEPNRVFMLTAFGVYAWIYPSSVILVMFDRVPPDAGWMSTFMLVVGGLVAASWVTLNYGVKRGLLASCCLLGLGLTVEAVGVASGFPFGRYSYSEVLSPKLFGVPLGISFAWLMIVLASFFTTRYLIRKLRPGWNEAALLGISAGLALISDLLMEPVAVYIQGYWTWQDQGFYYRVPEANFIAWGLISLGMVYLLNRLTTTPDPPPLRFQFIPLALYLMNLTMFTLVNFSHTNYLAGSIGLVCGMVCISLLYQARKTRPKNSTSFSSKDKNRPEKADRPVVTGKE